MKHLLIVVFSITLLITCNKKEEEKNVADKQSPPDTISTWTAGIVHDSTGTAADTFSVIQEVRTARHEEFDRIVYQFDKRGIPGFHIEYVDEPVYECGSGKPLKVQGDGWLMIKFLAARMHEEGTSTIPQRDMKPDLPILLQLNTACDFENHVTWIASVKSPNRFQVLTLTNPPRFVVDIRH